MDTRVICFSRSMSGGGDEIARKVADKIRFRYVDDEIIITAAEKEGVSPIMIGKVERSSPIIDRILGSMSYNNPKQEEKGGGSYQITSSKLSQSEGYRQIIQDVIVETAKMGKVVIVAHGAAIPLSEMSGVLRVFVTASQSNRTKRHMSTSNLDEQKAREDIVASDRQRTDYFRKFYHIDQELPTHYDIVLNTDHLTPSIAVDVVVRIAKKLKTDMYEPAQDERG